jgi:Uma2 family endonuclease
MKPHTEATIEDLVRVPENGKAELVNGEVVRMTPTGWWPGRAALKITMSLEEYGVRTNTGAAVPDNVGFLVNLPQRRSFTPDAGFYTGDGDMRFVNGIPVFAVEVRSEGDYGPAAEQEMAAKRADYFAVGTLVVWDVDLLGEDIVRVYRAADPTRPTIYRRGDIAEAEPAVPGWSMPVNAILPY